MSDKSHSDQSLVPGTPHISSRRFSASLVWLVPIAAALIGLSMVIHSWLSAGPKITVSFETAEGLEANKTRVKYKNVIIGTVTGIGLSDDRSQVNATIELDAAAKPFTTEDTLFWVVRPRIGASGVSGVDTLFSGAFIGADAGHSAQTTNKFVGLESPPPVTYGEKGKHFFLHTDDLGSLDIGSPVYYRRIQVGQVISYQLSPDGKGVDLQIFINSPNDAFVFDDTRFWNASGIDVTVGASGVKVDTESLSSILAGGIAFREPNYTPNAKLADANQKFALFDDQKTALAPPDGPAHYIRMRFDQSLRGLSINAPVEFLGVEIGKVVSIDMDYDDKTQHFPAVVGALIYPQRLGSAHEKLVRKFGKDNEERSARLLQSLIEHGLRAQARTGNVLTGQLYISLDFDSTAKKVKFDVAARPLEVPTVPGSFDKLQEQLQAMVDKISKIPIDSIANNLDGSLKELQRTIKQFNSDTLPQINVTLDQARKALERASETFSDRSPERQQLGQAMDEVQRTARSVRLLTDFLSRHPESLIRGRSADRTTEPFDIQMEPQQ
ncbi:intermembrane transport protein PqiB [Azomonas macrocytogenes]|uniref:Paraquat-inducible protein B n=1 Tax=Azomonas macrocytogenes TaxID=69962 RepID=A0A839SYJ6_AZOMA|nr:MlaD family protein [Azomonas macrocytogenes]MBB3101769.1 paraquat-inducible protein B [Azomonas macrocytogenes]